MIVLQRQTFPFLSPNWNLCYNFGKTFISLNCLLCDHLNVFSDNRCSNLWSELSFLAHIIYICFLVFMIFNEYGVSLETANCLLLPSINFIIINFFLKKKYCVILFRFWINQGLNSEFILFQYNVKDESSLW